jgi:hypothetical protein
MDDSWQKSSYSGSTNPNCVECRTDGQRVQVRDTQNTGLGHLTVPAPEWRAFLAAVRQREL